MDDSKEIQEEKNSILSVFVNEISEYWKPWLASFYPQGNAVNEIKTGAIVGFEQIGVSIAFAMMIGVEPQAGLHATWIIGLCSLLGSRPGMVTGATAVQAVVLAPYIDEHGVGYLPYIVMFMSVFQVFFGFLKISSLLNIIPQTVLIGFVNALAIDIAIGQFKNFKEGKVWLPSNTIGYMWILIIITFIIVVMISKLKYTKFISPALSAILVGIFVEHVIFDSVSVRTNTLGDLYDISSVFPTYFSNNSQDEEQIPSLDWDVFSHTVGPAFVAAGAGALECVLTMETVNDLSESENHRPGYQWFALSLGNLISGLFGAIGGGASVKLSVMNCTNGANGKFRVSGLVSSITVFIIAVGLTKIVKLIPIASIVGVMFAWCFMEFDWRSLQICLASLLPQRLRNCKREWFVVKINRLDALAIILVTFVGVVQNLLVAILFGVLFTGIVYSWDSGKEIDVSITMRSDGTKVYKVQGPLFFGSFQNFVKLFTVDKDPSNIEIDFSSDAAHVYDYSALYGLTVLAEKYKKVGKVMKVSELDNRSRSRISKASYIAKVFDYNLVTLIDGMEPSHKKQKSTDKLLDYTDFNP